MTRQDGSSLSTPSGSANDGDYTRKLALAILSTLQSRGLLSAADVDAILIAARRSAHQAMQNSAAQHQPSPSPSQGGVTEQTTTPSAESAEGSPEADKKLKEEVETPETQAKGETSLSEAPDPDVPQPGQDERQPPMFDIKLD